MAGMGIKLFERTTNVSRKYTGNCSIILIHVDGELSQNQGHFEGSFNSALIFTQAGSANSIQQSATIGANYFGTFRFRFKTKSKSSWVFNYGYAKNSQVYQSNFDYHQLDTIHEYTGAYVRNFHETGKFQPFFLFGAGLLRFNPRSTWAYFPDLPNNIPNRLQINVNAQSQNEATLVWRRSRLQAALQLRSPLAISWTLLQ